MSTALAAVHSSNMPSHHKSAIRRFWEQAKGGGSSMLARGGKHLSATGAAFRQGGESILMGGILGAVHVEYGLDIKVPKSTIVVPVDALTAGVGLLGGVALAHQEGGVDLRNAGASAATVFAFRKTYDFMAEKKKASGGKVAGSFGEDSSYGMHGEEEDAITACARQIG